MGHVQTSNILHLLVWNDQKYSVDEYGKALGQVIFPNYEKQQCMQAYSGGT